MTPATLTEDTFKLYVKFNSKVSVANSIVDTGSQISCFDSELLGLQFLSEIEADSITLRLLVSQK